MWWCEIGSVDCWHFFEFFLTWSRYVALVTLIRGLIKSVSSYMWWFLCTIFPPHSEMMRPSCHLLWHISCLWFMGPAVRDCWPLDITTVLRDTLAVYNMCSAKFELSETFYSWVRSTLIMRRRVVLLCRIVYCLHPLYFCHISNKFEVHNRLLLGSYSLADCLSQSSVHHHELWW